MTNQADVSVDLASDTSSSSLAKAWPNELILVGENIKSIRFSGEFVVSEGQPYSPPPSIAQTGDTWKVTFECGRHKTKEVADQYNAIVEKPHHGYNPNASDTKPAELNFFGGLELVFDVNGEEIPVAFHVGQGSNDFGNNWWLGGAALGVVSMLYQVSAIVPIVGPAGVTQAFQVINEGHYQFRIAPLLAQRDLHKQPDWLRKLPDEIAINEINLPGTHDSAAINTLGHTPYSCHNSSLSEQMLSGVRLFDIRLSIHKNGDHYKFMTCHGDFGDNEYQSFESAMQEFAEFLKVYRTEFVAVSLKVDDWNGIKGESQQKSAFNALANLLAHYPIVARSDLPKLSEVREKIYLLNRLNSQARFGPPISWKDATPGEIVPPTLGRSFSLAVQDKYKGLQDLEKEKFALWKDELKNVQQGRLSLNFASATTGLFGAKGIYIMDRVLSWLGASSAETRSNKLGWNLFDYENSQYACSEYGYLTVVQLLIDSNFGYVTYPNAFQVGSDEL